MISCKKKTTPIYRLPDNAAGLLTGDSVKTWKIARRYNGKARMNMGECFLGYRQRFRESGHVSDNNSELRNCGPSLKAEWEITTTDKGHSYLKLTSDQIPALLNQAENYKLFKILFISRDSLPNWGWGLAGGLFDIIFALILLSNPALTATTLPFVVGFWIIIYIRNRLRFYFAFALFRLSLLASQMYLISKD